MNIKELYLSSLKKKSSEEFFDLIFFRPLGFLLAFISRKTFLTPNHLTILSMILGVGSGFLYYFHSYEAGALILLLANTFDCADGQLARMKKVSSKIGSILDGSADYITYIASYAGACFALIRDTGDFYFFWIGWIAGISTAIQAGIFDDYRNQYLHNNSIEEMTKDLEESNLFRQNTRNLFYKIMFWAYLIYLKKQIKTRTERPDMTIRDRYIRLMTFIGYTGHE